jgi:hypothetical protein
MSSGRAKRSRIDKEGRFHRTESCLPDLAGLLTVGQRSEQRLRGRRLGRQLSIQTVVVRRSIGAFTRRTSPSHNQGSPMTKMIFISLPVTDLQASIAFYKALGFQQNLRFSDTFGMNPAAIPSAEPQS